LTSELKIKCEISDLQNELTQFHNTCLAEKQEIPIP